MLVRYKYKTGFLLLALSLVLIVPSCKNIFKKSKAEIPIEELNILAPELLYKDLGKSVRDKKARQIERTFQHLERSTGFNGVVLYAEQGQLVFEKTFGYENPRTRRIPLELNSRFELASVSKIFTATAILILKERGLLDLDQDIRHYIPDWPYEHISVRHLLTHRSGLSRYESLADEYWPDQAIFLSNDAMIELYRKHLPTPYFQPDNGFHYCNVNYALLGSIIERVSGQSFASFMRENIFEPAGMHHSMIYEANYDAPVSGYPEGIVSGYDIVRKGMIRVADNYLNGVQGDKGMFSTVGDLFNFELALNGGLLISEESIKEAYSPGSPAHKGRKDNYGLGWRIKSESDSAIYHYGWWKGFRNFFIRDLAQQKTLIILTNKSKAPSPDTFWNLIQDTTNDLPEASANAAIMLKRKPTLTQAIEE